MAKRKKKFKQFKKEEQVDSIAPDAYEVDGTVTIPAKEELTQEKFDQLYSKMVDEAVEEVKEEIVKELEEAEPEEFTHEQLHAAILEVADVMERSHMNWVCLGELAYQIHKFGDPILDLEYIHIGIKENEATNYGMETLRMFWRSMAESDNGYEYIHTNGVPIKIDILDKDDPYANNPDSTFYYTENLKLPNPFPEYWKGYNQ